MMIELILFYLLGALAISNLSYILTSVDLLACPRKWFEETFPRLKKLATCKFCQSFWMSGAFAVFLALNVWPSALDGIGLWLRIPILWLAIHWLARLGHVPDDFGDGIPVRAPFGIYANVNLEKPEKPMDGQGSAV